EEARSRCGGAAADAVAGQAEGRATGVRQNPRRKSTLLIGVDHDEPPPGVQPTRRAGSAAPNRGPAQPKYSEQIESAPKPRARIKESDRRSTTCSRNSEATEQRIPEQ